MSATSELSEEKSDWEVRPSEVEDDEVEPTAERGAAGAELALVGANEVAALRSVEPPVSGPLAVPTEQELLALVKFGKVLYASGMFPDLQGAAQAVVKVLAGRSYGLGPIESQGAFCMVQGRLTQYAKFQSALIKRSRRFDYRVLQSTSELCELEWFERDGCRGEGWQSIGTSSFTLKEAASGGLGKSASGRPGAWQQFPKSMLFARALTQGVTWFCPHLTYGRGFNEGHNDDLVAWGQDDEQ